MRAKCLNTGNGNLSQIFGGIYSTFINEWLNSVLYTHAVGSIVLSNVCVCFTSPDMNKILTDIILDSCVSVSLMPDKLLMEHIMLLTILASRIGMEVGEAKDNAVIVNIEGGRREKHHFTRIMRS